MEGYYISFDAKSLVGYDAFGVEVFKTNPLVAIQHDGDLSKIEDNSLLNSIISHEEIVMNEKHKPKYSMRIGCFLFLGTNKPVSISDTNQDYLEDLSTFIHLEKKCLNRNTQSWYMISILSLGAIADYLYYEISKNGGRLLSKLSTARNDVRNNSL